MPRIVSLFAVIPGRMRRSPSTYGCKAVMEKRGTAEERGAWKRSKIQLAPGPSCNANLKSLQMGVKGLILPLMHSSSAHSDPPVTCSPSDPHSQPSVPWWAAEPERERDQDRAIPALSAQGTRWP